MLYSYTVKINNFNRQPYNDFFNSVVNDFNVVNRLRNNILSKPPRCQNKPLNRNALSHGFRIYNFTAPRVSLISAMERTIISIPIQHIPCIFSPLRTVRHHFIKCVCAWIVNIYISKGRRLVPTQRRRDAP